MTDTLAGPRPSPTVSRPGLVTDIIEFSAVDGPGNRFVVFLQGCSFDCLACHNPYTINPCNDCGECVAGCPSGALSMTADGRVAWDAAACQGTDRCIAACSYDSTPKARRLTVADVVERLRPAAPFLSGITVTGGEAMRQVIFLRELFLAVRADPQLSRLTCFVDTNGHVNGPHWDLMCPVMDAAMVDLKCLDGDLHRRIAGEDNAKVLASISTLAERRKLYEVRLLMLAGLNDSDDLLARTGQWLAERDPTMRIKVIGYRHHGVRQSPVPLREPSADQRSHYADVLRAQSPAFELVVV